MKRKPPPRWLRIAALASLAVTVIAFAAASIVEPVAGPDGVMRIPYRLIPIGVAAFAMTVILGGSVVMGRRE